MATGSGGEEARGFLTAVGRWGPARVWSLTRRGRRPWASFVSWEAVRACRCHPSETGVSISFPGGSAGHSRPPLAG